MELDSRNNEIDDVVIKIDELTVWTPEERSWWRRKVTKPSTLILNNISGCLRAGEFAAILGPSGAGKTTFLVSLAGKCQLPSFGTVMLGGRDVRRLRSAVDLVPQFDVFVNELTVLEHLVFMAELKVGSCKNPNNKIKLTSLLEELKLKKHAHTRIGSLSGGEKRLLSLATSLLSNPQVLVCDEPTTGLDSYNALLVIETLKKLSLTGKVIVCSVHQPSADLFKEFNSLMLMADGKLLFHGSHEDCKALFDSINLRCPKNYNPAEFYIRAISHINQDNDRIMASYHERLQCSDESDATPEKKLAKVFRRNWFKQVHLLLWRASLTFKRDVKGQMIQLFINVVVSSMIIGTCYAGISGTTQNGVQDVRGLLWLMTSEVCFGMSYTALYAFEGELMLFKREVGTYSCSSYLVSRFLSYIPRCIVWPIVLVFLMTLAVQLPNHIVTAFEFFVTLSVAAIAASAYGLGMGALFTSTGLMGDVMPCVDLPLFLLSGVFIRVYSLPVFLHPFKFISHFYYGMDAMSNIYWRQIDHIDCPWNATSICVNDGPSVLAEAGYSSAFVLQDSLGLLGVTLFWTVLAYCGLKREETKGYAY